MATAAPAAPPAAAAGGEEMRTNPETLTSWLLNSQVGGRTGWAWRGTPQCGARAAAAAWTACGPRRRRPTPAGASLALPAARSSAHTPRLPSAHPPPRPPATPAPPPSPPQHISAPGARGSLTILLNSVCVACKFVQSAVRKAGLAGVLGLAGETNVQGEAQKKLDVLANEVFVNVLSRCGQCALLVSEEDEEPTVVPLETAGDYIVTFDPLDGSSNIDCGVSIGTIYGIYKVPPGTAKGDAAALTAAALRPGSAMVAAGYCLYGSSCAMVLAIGPTPPSVFTLDPSLGEFVLTADRVAIPRRGAIYSANEGNASLWDAGTTAYIAACKSRDRAGGAGPMSARYVGSMVADVHRTLLYGGIFVYPADTKSRAGKLRLLYEGNPMAFIVEGAGGRALAGPGVRVLDLKPGAIHERVPVFLGSADDVAEAEAALAADAGHLQVRA